MIAGPHPPIQSISLRPVGVDDIRSARSTIATGGVPMALNARTGECTPPGVTWRARSIHDALVDRGVIDAAPGCAASDRRGDFAREISDHQIAHRLSESRSWSPTWRASDRTNRDRRRHAASQTLPTLDRRQPARPRCRARRGSRRDTAGRLHHHHVRAFGHVGGRFADGFAHVRRIHLIGAAIAELGVDPAASRNGP